MDTYGWKRCFGDGGMLFVFGAGIVAVLAVIAAIVSWKLRKRNSYQSIHWLLAIVCLSLASEGIRGKRKKDIRGR